MTETLIVETQNGQGQPRPAFSQVVAALLTHQGRIGLFRRSPHVSGDVGRWHCITGFLPDDAEALNHAFVEIHEETGIPPLELTLLNSVVLDLKGGDGRYWRVHAYHFQSRTDSVQLNWENDIVRWVEPERISLLPTVSWLDDVLDGLSIQISGSSTFK